MIKKLWTGLAWCQFTLGVFSMGIGWIMGPIFMFAAIKAHDPMHWGVSILFFTVGLVLTVNLIHMVKCILINKGS